jgi:hypothetical protein
MTKKSDAMLPREFAELEPFARQWCLPTETERYARRLEAPMADMQAFYDAFFPRAQEALDFCDRYFLDDLPDEVVNLMRLLYSLVTISPAVETWRQARIPDTGASKIVCLVEPIP